MRAHLTLAGLLLIACTFAWTQTVVEGTIHDKSGTAVAGATVDLKRSNGSPLASQVTTTDGHFRFNAVDAGAYRLQATAPNFYISAYEFVLRQRQPVAVDLQLERKETVSQQVEVREQVTTISWPCAALNFRFTNLSMACRFSTTCSLSFLPESVRKSSKLST